MQNTIMGYNQQVAIDNDLDMIDLTILQWFVNFKNKKEYVEDGVTYYWLNYQTLIDDLPVLGINSKVVIRRRLKKLEDCGMLKHICVKEGGTFSYYAVDKGYDNLIGKTTVAEAPKGNKVVELKKSNAPKNETKEGYIGKDIGFESKRLKQFNQMDNRNDWDFDEIERLEREYIERKLRGEV